MKKILSIILALVLCLSTLTVASSAKEDTPFYLVLGDSIAYGSGLGNPTEACYGKIVADTNGYDYANYAVPGHTTTNLISRLELPEVVEALYENDLGKTNVALVTTPATDINIPEYFTAFLDIIGFVFNLMGSVYDFVSQNFYYLNLL